jgi:hypothetical protein
VWIFGFLSGVSRFWELSLAIHGQVVPWYTFSL